MSITYRHPTPDDLTELAAFAAHSFTEKFGHIYSPENLAEHLEKFCSLAYFDNQLSYTNILLACDGDKLIGYGKWGELVLPVDNPTEPHGEIHRLYVEGEYQGQRIGHQMLTQMLEVLADKKEIYLSVFSENFGAQRFYERYGFNKVKEYHYMVGTHADLDFIYGLKR